MKELSLTTDLMFNRIHYRYYHWEGGENGCNIGWMKYQIQQAFFNKDKVYIDNFESLCTIKRWRGVEL